MEADSTQHRMLKAKKRRNSSTSVSSVTTSSSNSSSDGSSSTSSSSSSSDDRRRKKKSSASKRKRTRKRTSSGSESELDLTKELFPISGYIKTKDIMMEQMFKSISRKKLKAMLPDILKNVPLNKLKKMCLDQLEVMSKKRIYRTLAGENPDAISSSGTDESTDDSSKANGQLSPQKSDILQNIETVDQAIVAEMTENTNGDATTTLNSDVTDILNDNAPIESLHLGANSKDVNKDNLNEANNSNSNADPNSDSEFNNSCDESIPSSVPDLESEPDDFYGPFHYSEDNNSEVDDVAHDSNDSIDSIDAAHHSNDSIDSNIAAHHSNDSIDSIDAAPNSNDSIDNSVSSENMENNDEEDVQSSLITDKVKSDDLLSVENSNKQYKTDHKEDLSDQKVDKDHSNNQLESLISDDPGKSEAVLVKENSINLDRGNSPLQDEAQQENITSTCSDDHTLTKSDTFDGVSYFEDKVKKSVLNDTAEKFYDLKSCINLSLYVESNDLLFSSDINAMIMKVDDKEFFDEEDDEEKVDSTNDIDVNFEPTNPIISNKIINNEPTNPVIPNKIINTELANPAIPNKIINTEPNECRSSIESMSELELLELEMRARAIKAMIKAQEDSKPVDSNTREVFVNSKRDRTDAHNSIYEVKDNANSDGNEADSKPRVYEVKDSRNSDENETDSKPKRISVKSRLGSVVSRIKTPNSKVYNELNSVQQVKGLESKSCSLLVSLGQGGEARTVDLKVEAFDRDLDDEILNTGSRLDFGNLDGNLQSEFPQSVRHVEIMSTSLRDVQIDYSFEDQIEMTKTDE